MRLHAVILGFAIGLLFPPGVAAACVYPMPLRVVNDTLITALDRKGEVDNYTRNRLRRTLDYLSVDAMIDALSGEVSRRDLRAVRSVIGVAAALADGRGLIVDADLRADTTRLKQAVQTACSDATLGVSSAGKANGSERGGARRQGTGRGLTFREGMVRLSLAFTLYLAFLVFLFFVRQRYKPPVSAPEADGFPGKSDVRGGNAPHRIP